MFGQKKEKHGIDYSEQEEAYGKKDKIELIEFKNDIEIWIE